MDEIHVCLCFSSPFSLHSQLYNNPEINAV